MECVLKDSYAYTLCFVDDVVICSDTFEEHVKHVTTVIESLTKWNLSLNIEKCQWCFMELSALGHRIGVHGRSADPDKLQKAIRWTRPSSGKQMMAFLGFTNYLRDYLVHYASLVAPLDCLRSFKTILPGDWTPERLAAFNAIRHAFAHAPQLLQAPLPGHPLMVATDASQLGIGAVVYQMIDGKPRYIEFASRSLNVAQRNYSATRRELLAVVFALQRFQFYLQNSHFILQTDHRALVFMLTQQHVNPMLCTWLDTILAYDFEVQHISGVLNILPDALSRQYPSHLRDRSPLCLELGSNDPAPPLEHTRAFYEYRKSTIRLEGGETTDPAIRSVRLLERYPTLPESMRVARNAVAAPVVKLLHFKPFAQLFTANIRMNKRLSTVASSSSSSGSVSPVDIAVDEGMPDERDIKELISNFTQCKDPVNLDERAKLIENAHIHGHVGGRKTALAVVRAGYYWRGLMAECHKVAASCLECQRYNVGKHGFNPIMVVTSDYPWQQISYDLKEFTAMKSNEGFNYALVVVDRFSKYVLLRPLKSKMAEEVTHELLVLYSHFGFTSIVQHDNGTEFSNLSADNFYRIVGTDVRVSTPYHKRGNGIVENVIKNMELILYKAVQGQLSLWHKYLPLVEMTMNSIESGPTGSSPYSIVFGRKPVLNLSGSPMTVRQLTTEKLIDETDASKVHQWQQHMHAVMETIYPIIKERVTNARQKGADRDHKGHAACPTGYFPLESFVMVVNLEKTAKHDVKYIGPMQVKAFDARNGCYKLMDAEGKLLPRSVHADQMKSVVPKASTFTKEGELSIHEVDAVVKHRAVAGKENAFLYLVKWKGEVLDENEDNWLAYDRFVDKEVIQKYWKLIEGKSDVDLIPNYAKKAFLQLKQKNEEKNTKKPSLSATDSSSVKRRELVVSPGAPVISAAEPDSVKRRKSVTPLVKPKVIKVSPEEYKELYDADKEGIPKWIDQQTPEQLMKHTGLRSRQKHLK